MNDFVPHQPRCRLIKSTLRNNTLRSYKMAINFQRVLAAVRVRPASPSLSLSCISRLVVRVAAEDGKERQIFVCVFMSAPFFALRFGTRPLSASLLQETGAPQVFHSLAIFLTSRRRRRFLGAKAEMLLLPPLTPSESHRTCPAQSRRVCWRLERGQLK